MPNKQIERPEAARARVAVGKTNFDQNFVDRGDGNDTVPGTDVPRLRPVALGLRAIGFFSDEVDALIEGLRRWRDSTPQPPRKEPAALRRSREGHGKHKKPADLKDRHLEAAT
jgi:hypothetical protein